MSKVLRLLPTLGMLLPLAACETRSADGTDLVAIEVLYQHNQCQTETAKAVLIDSAADLSAWWQPLARMSLPAAKLPASLRQVDWNQKKVVVVYAGSQPSAGYQFELPDETAEIENQALNVDIRLTEPTADAVVAQVVTSPCVLIAANNHGYTAVKIKDETGTMFPAAP